MPDQFLESGMVSALGLAHQLRVINAAESSSEHLLPEGGVVTTFALLRPRGMGALANR
jgi:hypothetical protein